TWLWGTESSQCSQTYGVSAAVPAAVAVLFFASATTSDHRWVLPPPDDYAELVLDTVATIPEGRVASYGAVAAAVREVTGRGSARVVGRVMARYGSEVCWWRVV